MMNISFLANPYLWSFDFCFKFLEGTLLSFWVITFAMEPHAWRIFSEEFSIKSCTNRLIYSAF